VAIEAGAIDERRLALASLVPSQRAAFDLDALLLATDRGEVWAPTRALSSASPEARSPRSPRPTRAVPARLARVSGIVSRCRKKGRSVSVALIGVRKIDPLLERLGKTAM